MSAIGLVWFGFIAFWKWAMMLVGFLAGAALLLCVVSWVTTGENPLRRKRTG